MLLVLVLVFIGVFGLLTLLLVASGSGASQRTKQTLMVLESVLAVESSGSKDPIVDVRKNELLSAIPWINRWLLKLEIAPRLRTLLYQANLKWTAGGLLLMSAGFFVVPAYLVYLRTGTVALGMLIGLFTAGLPFFFVRFKRSQRFNKFEQELPEALDLMVSALRAGHSLVSALGLIAHESPDPIGMEFRTCYEEQNYGLDLRTAMGNLITRAPLQDLRIVVTAILIQKDSGGNLAEVLDKTAYVIRERYRLKREVRTRTAQGRMTGWILTILPIALGFVLYMVNPKGMSLLWHRAIGIKLLYAAATLMVIGSLIIRKIVNMDV
ncbi:MAG TPA: type II secretion system F family protein [Acidobacteriaceae bacterium]|nr:type II secretion system F family protein [Terriglobia bacterium]HVC91364.1 type II secretion system F family protein [Acidobacteriaceae bacterium]